MRRTATPHLGLVPALHVAAVLLSDGLVLSSDVGQHSVHVGLRLGVHLHVDGAGRHLVAHDRELLKAERERRVMGLEEKEDLAPADEPDGSCEPFVFLPAALTSAWFFFR